MRKILSILLLALLLTGCKTVLAIKPDTIVDIPLHPTEAQTRATIERTEAPTENVPQSPETEAPTEKPTRATDSGGSSGGKTTGGKTSGSGNGGSKKPAQTPATEPPTEALTEPPTQPPTEAPTQPATEPPTEAAAYDPSGYSPGSLDRAVADAVNGRRQAAGLPPLALDTRLCAIASVRAYEASVVWSQTRPDGSAGITALNAYGYGYSTAAQNLYFGAGGAESIVSKWMSSEARKENILMEAATAIGVGSYTADDGLTYVAAFFVG